MSPIDDEVRSTLASRTDEIALSPDFFTGVERRAKRMHRHRVAASVAGSALAVSALGLGGPMLASTLARDPAPPMATAGPTQMVEQSSQWDLDPAAPWGYRGERSVLGDDNGAAFAREYEARHPELGSQQWAFAPLYGEVFEPSGVATLVFLAVDASGEARWAVGQSSESGPELLLDEPLATGTRALAAALPGDEAARLLVVAAPAVGDLEYAHDDASEWLAMESVALGVAGTPLEGNPAADRFRVLTPEGDVLLQQAAPDATFGPAADEGPGTDVPLPGDPAPYALDLDDPWDHRGPVELNQHPNLAAEDARLFADGAGRGDGSWSHRPLLATELPDGLSLLVVLHTKGGEAVVTTTSQRQDEAARQSQQVVTDGQRAIQTFVPELDGGLLVVLASPRAGAVETDLPGAQRLVEEPGAGLWRLSTQPSAGSVFLYGEGGGLLYHSEAARRS